MLCPFDNQFGSMCHSYGSVSLRLLVISDGQNSNAQSDSESNNNHVSQHHHVPNHHCVLSVDSSMMLLVICSSGPLTVPCDFYVFFNLFPMH